jgi:hypothetical protein
MQTLLKRVRGAVGMGLTWAGLWSAVGALVAVSTWTNLPGVLTRLDWIVGFAAQFAVLGFVGGMAFSTVLGVIEGHRRFDQMSVPRFAVWGALGGLAMWAARGTIGWSVMGFLNTVGVSGLNWGYGLSGGIIVVLGAGCSTGSLLLARRVGDQELLEAGERVAGVGLTAREVRELL